MEIFYFMKLFYLFKRYFKIGVLDDCAVFPLEEPLSSKTIKSDGVVNTTSQVERLKQKLLQNYLKSLRTEPTQLRKNSAALPIWHARYQGVCLFERHFIVTGNHSDKIPGVIIRRVAALALKEVYPFNINQKKFQNLVRRYLLDFILYGFNPALGLRGGPLDASVPTITKKCGKYYKGVKLINFPPK